MHLIGSQAAKSLVLRRTIGRASSKNKNPSSLSTMYGQATRHRQIGGAPSLVCLRNERRGWIHTKGGSRLDWIVWVPRERTRDACFLGFIYHHHPMAKPTAKVVQWSRSFHGRCCRLFLVAPYPNRPPPAVCFDVPSSRLPRHYSHFNLGLPCILQRSVVIENFVVHTAHVYRRQMFWGAVGLPASNTCI